MIRTSKPARAARQRHALARRRLGHPFFRPSFERLESRRLLNAAGSPTLLGNYADAPMMFEANQGQTAPQVRFLSRGNGYALYLTDTEAVLNLTDPSGSGAAAVLTMSLAGGNPAPRVTGQDELATKSNYLTGNDPSQWHTDVPDYASVGYQAVYPGIDLTYYGNGQQLEYDFTVAPGADPSAIRLNFKGDTGREIDAQGDLVLHTGVGDVVEQAPAIYQGDGADRQAVSGGYVLNADGSVGFAVGAYDPSRPLVIDPVLAYSTYLGNDANGLDATVTNAVAADSKGNVYLTGYTNSTEFPPFPPGSLQGQFTGAVNGSYGLDAFVAKLDPTGQIVFFTYLGGNPDDSHPNVYNVGEGIAVHDDGQGNVSIFVVGQTLQSGDSNVADPEHRDSFLGFSPLVKPFQSSPGEGFVAELDPTGSHLVYSSYLSVNNANGIAVDAAGNAYVVGTVGHLPGSSASVTRVNPDGSLGWTKEYGTADFATFGQAIAVSGQGKVYFTGYTSDPGFAPQTPVPESPARYSAYVAEIDSAGNYVAGARLGGGMDNGAPFYADNIGNGIAVGPTGDVYLTGTTLALDFPTTAGAFQTSPPRQDAADGVAAAFVACFTGDLSHLVYSTYLGGHQPVLVPTSSTSFDPDVGEFGHAIAVDAAGDAYVVGSTGSTDFPTVDPIQSEHNPEPPEGPFGNRIVGPSDGFVTELDPSGKTLVFSTYLGGSGNDVAAGVAMDGLGDLYVVGTTESADFPTTRSAVQPSFTRPPPGPAGYGLGFETALTQGLSHYTDMSFDTPTAFVAKLAPPLRVTALPISAYLGVAYTKPVATFTAPDPTQPASAFQVTIDWGDGTTTSGIVSQPGGPLNPYQVTGDHIYFTPGSYPVVVHVTDPLPTRTGTVQLQATTAVDVTRAPGEQSETSIAVDPSHPNRLFAVSNDVSNNRLYAAYSSDGGVTWARATDGDGNLMAVAGAANPTFSLRGDPRVTFDSLGNLYLVGLDVSARAIVLLVSADGGQTFKFVDALTTQGSAPPDDPEGAEVDQPSIAAGPGDQPSTASVWITYDDVGAQTVYAAGARATGLGQVGPLTVTNVGQGRDGNFGNVAVGPAGQVVVVWQNFGADATHPANAILVSTNPAGLASPRAFGAPAVVGQPLAVNDDYLIPAQPDRGITPDIRLAWDRSGGPHNGRLYMTYTDAPLPTSAPADTEIFLRHSDDNGQSWSAPVIVNDDTGAGSQFFASVAVDQTDGDVAVAWYDARNDPANTAVEYMVAVSGDGGQTFSRDLAVTVSPSNATLAERSVAPGNRNQFGDYEGLDFNAGLLYPAWTDNSEQLRGNATRPEFELAAARVAVAHVTVAPPVVTANALSLTEGDLFSGSVATFTDGDATLGSADFKATIDWGDGSTSSGVITQVGDPTFAVHGTHSYKTAGAYVVTVTVTDTVHGLVATTAGNVSQMAGDQSETSVAIDPKDPSDLFVASNRNGKMVVGLFVAYSTDGGVTWNGRVLGDGSDGLPVAFSDPKVVFDRFGNLFLTYLTTGDLTRVVLAASTDGGQSFRVVDTVSDPDGADQPSVAVGPGRTAEEGSAWLTFLIGDNDITAAGISVSGLGQYSLLGETQIGPGPSDANTRNFGDIAVGPNGQVLIVYQTPSTGAGPSQIFVNLDADGLGNGGFGAPVLVTGTNVGGFDPIPPQTTRTIGAEANLAWDLSNGPHRGRVYLVYTDAPSVGSPDTNIFVRFSDDDGKTWSDPVQVNDDKGGASQFLPGIAVDPTTGDVAVSWYDARNDPDDVKAAFFAAVSSDGGLTFSPNAQVSPGASDATDPGLNPAGQDNQYGDYTGLVFQGGILYPAWTDNSPELGQNPDPPQFEIAAARTGTAHVADAPLTATALDISADVNDEGEEFNADLATFTDPDPDAALDLYTATIDWGDKTDPGQGTIRAGGGQFLVSGKHAYEEEGSYTITVTIKDKGGAETKVTLDADVEDGKLTAVGPTLRPAEGVPFTGAVAAFTDSDPNGQPDDYVTAIDWGDGTQTAGRVVFDGTAALAWSPSYQQLLAVGQPSSGPGAGVNSLLLLGNTQSGLTTPLLPLGPDFRGGLAVDNQQRIYAVSNNDAGESFLNLLDVGAGKIDPVAYLGTGFTGGLTFDAHDGNFYAIATTGADSTLFAIDPTTWAVRPVADLGPLAFSGLAFDPLTTDTLYAVANDSDGQSTLYRITLGAAPVAQSLFVLGTGYTGGVAAALPENGGLVTDELVGVAGDGSGSAVLNVIDLSGVVSPVYEVGSQFNDGFDVVGSHTYAEEGTLPLSVHIKDLGGSVATAAGTAQIVDDPPAALPAPAAVSAFQGFFTGPLTLGAFTVPGGAEAGAGEYTATVSWRDGSAPEAAAVSVAGSTITVTSAGHAYTTAGTFQPLVTLTDDTGNSATLTDAVNVVPDVTGQVRVVGLGGPVNPLTGLMTSTGTITNVGAVTIHGPLYLVVHGLPAGVTLANTAGTVVPAGNGAAEPYVVVSLAQLKQGQSSAPITLQFSDPSLEPFTYGVIVIDGPTGAAAPPPPVIDPALDFSTYLGGSFLDLPRAVAVDAAGNTYVAGVTYSSDFPSLNSLNPGVAPSDAGFASDAFVTKLDPSGQIVYSTFLGDVGAGVGTLQAVTGLAVNAAGDVYVTGRANTTDFPTLNALQPASNGDGFTSYLAELNAAGDLVFSTYLNDVVTRALALDGAGNVYLAGLDGGGIQPTPGATSTAPSGSFVAKLSPAGDRVLYATYVPGTENQLLPGGTIAAGGEVRGLAVDAAGEIVVTGDTNEATGLAVHAAQPTFGGGHTDAFAAKLTADGSALEYWTYLGGSGDEAGSAVALDAAGNAYVVGTTDSADFPTDGAIQTGFGGGAEQVSRPPLTDSQVAGDAFLTKLDPAGALVFSTYLGGSGSDTGTAVAVDAAGNAYVTGQTDSADFPTAHALQPTLGGDQFTAGDSVLGRGDAFLTRINSSGSALDYSTFLGGANGVDGGTAVAVSPAGGAVVAGFTNSDDFPTLNAAQPQAAFFPTATSSDLEDTDAFVTRIDAAGPGTLTVSNVPFRATEGVPFTGAVAAFTDTDTDVAGDYTATIDWGDGTTSAGVIVSDSARGGGFRVEGTHTYAEEGAYPVSVSVHDADGSNGTATGTTISQSLGGPVTYRVSVDTSSLAGTSGYLDLQFNPGALPGAQAAAATVSNFRSVGGSTGSVTSTGGATGSLGGVAQLNNGETLNELRQAFTFGTSLSFDVTFDGDALALPAGGDFGSTFALTLLGSDGQTPLESSAPAGTVARVTLAPDGGTQFLADAPGVAQAAAVTMTTVADAPLTATLVPIQAVEGTPFTGTVATFTDANPNGALGDFTASVLWGDGTGATAGTVVADGGGRFHVIAGHTYAEAGNFGIRVVITDKGGASVAAAAAPAGPSGLPGLQAARVAFVGQPLAFASGDFNGDGKPDLVIWSRVPNTFPVQASLEVLLGNGDGSFAPPVTLTTKVLTSSVPAIAVADLTGNGKLDIITDGVVFLGNGDGTFTAGPTFATGSDPLVGIAVADFDGDGKPDLALINGAGVNGVGSGVTILPGNGDGSFRPGVTYGASNPALSDPVSVVAGDFDGNGKPDLAVSILGGSAAILLNQGDGTFGPAAETIPGVTVGAAADLRGDGKMDLVGTDGSHAVVLLGKGDGTFADPVRYDAGPDPSAIIAADLDGDGKPDLVVFGGNAGGGSATTVGATVTVLKGNGDGTFAAPQTFPTLAPAAGVRAELVAADFNGDGKPDVAFLGSDTVSILFGRGDGSLADAAYSPGAGPATSLAAGDFNGDGKADVAAQVGGGVEVLPGQGDGTFQTAASVPAGPGGFGIVAGDFTGHGNTDIIEGSQLLPGRGDGTFGAPIDLGLGDPVVGGEDNFVNPGATVLADGDLTGDGKLDLVIANRNNAGTQTTVSVLLGHGDGTFTKAWSLIVSGNAGSATLADFNGDGKPDLVLGTDNGLLLLPGHGDGTFGTATTIAPGFFSGVPIFAGDFNADGKLDLALGVNGLTILPGRGDGTFGAPVAYDSSVFTSRLVMGDFDGDGKPDFAILHTDHSGSAQTDVTLLFGNGDGTFRTSETISTGLENATSLAAGDFNGDGKLDLAAGGAGIFLLLGNGDGTFQPGQDYAPAAGGLAGLGTLSAADVNHDGRADLIAGGTADASGANGATVQVFLGQSGGLSAGRLYLYSNGETTAGALGVLTADLNGDGLPDLAALVQVNVSGTDSVAVLLNRGDGTFQSTTYDLGGGVYNGLVAGDFTGDGKIDLVADLGNNPSAFATQRVFLKGNGDGTFQPARVTFTSSGATGRLLAADVNGDGKLDLVKLERSGAGTVIEADLGNGDGTFRAPIISGPFNDIDLLSAIPGFADADFNGDGKTDLVVGTTDGSVAVLPGDGDGTFGAPIVSPAGGPILDVVTGDLNGDGKMDVVVAHADGTVSELFGNGDGTFRAPLTYLAGGNPSNRFFLPGEMALDDFNGDGTPDVIVGGSNDMAVLINGPAAAPAQNVADAPLTAAGLNHRATEGAPFLGTVARFSDANPLATIDDFTAAITWGDGHSSAGTVQADGSGGFTVLGSNTFAGLGAFAAAVVITDRDGSTARVSDTITVEAGPDAPLAATGNSVTATALVPFTGVVATFTDGDAAAAADDFTATITWGDGHSSAGLVRAGASGGFEVVGTNTYAASGNFPTTIAVVDTGGATAAANGSAAVAPNADAPLAAAGLTFRPVEQTSFAGVVASFTDADPTGAAGDYTATIDWGDGQTSSGAVSADPLVAGQFDVTGTHSFLTAGRYGVTVSVTDNGGAAATADSTAAVADAPLTPSGTPVSATEGTAFAGIVATFADANPFSLADDFTATITWGDGHTSAGAVAADPQAPGHYTVSGSNTYAAAGLFAVGVAIADGGGATATARSLATVADAQLTATGVAVRASAGQAVTGVVASFTDANPTPPAGGYSATIFWGDGTTSDGDVQATSNGFSVTGTHTYAAPGAFSLHVTISDPGGARATASATATVTGPAPETSAVAVRATEGTPFSGPVASLTLPAWDHGPEDLTVSINWGDGHTSAGTLVSTAAGTLEIVGTNTYAEEGVFAVTVTVTDRSAAGITIPTTATVADAALTASPVPVSATGGVPFVGPVATFRDANPGAVAADFTATITWGDGQTSSGAVTAAPAAAGQFVVTGSHLYAAAGTFPVGVVIADVGGNTVPVRGSAAVRSAAGASFAAAADVPFSTVVATVAGAGSDAAGDFTATIDWGDGHTSAGLLTPDPAGDDRFLVLGAWTYQSAGRYPVIVSVDPPNGFRASVSGTATVGPAPDAPLTARPVLPIAARGGSLVRSVVAAFSDADPSGSPADFSGVINWGDGSTSAGSVFAAPGTPGLFFVLGSHTYAGGGSDPVLVSIRDVGGALVDAATLAVVADAPPGGPVVKPAAPGSTGPAEARVAGRAAPIVPGESVAPAFVLAGTVPSEAVPEGAPSVAPAPRAILVVAPEPDAGTMGSDEEDTDDFWPWVIDQPTSYAPDVRQPEGAPSFRIDGEDEGALPPPAPEIDSRGPSSVWVDEVFILAPALQPDRACGAGCTSETGQASSGNCGLWAGAVLAAGALGMAAWQDRRIPFAGRPAGENPAARRADEK